MRYKRQESLVNQNLLSNARVLVAGAGGLGSAALYYLAAAGIGNITIIDSDNVEESNLNRQILHFTDDIGKPKVISAVEKLERLNPEVEIDIRKIKITKETLHLLPKVDVVVDCLDNMETRLLLNEFCVEKRIPLVHAAVYGFEGRLTVIIPGKTPCLSCIYSNNASLKGEFPVLGATAGFLGSAEAAEVIKLITKTGKVLAGKMLVADLKTWNISFYETSWNKDCPVCGVHPDKISEDKD